MISNDPEVENIVVTTAAPTTPIPPPPPAEPIKVQRKSEQACQLIKNLKSQLLSYHILNGDGADVGEFP